MPSKDHIDLPGAIGLIGFSALLAFNQVVIAVVNEGLQPIFFAGLRSAGAVICVLIWMRLRGRSPQITPGSVGIGVIMGVIFSAEFTFLFIALDLTTVSRASVIFYTMPLWLALAGHFFLPGERMNWVKVLGLCLAFGGVVIAILFRSDGSGQASLAGDICALFGAFGWAAIAFASRTARLRGVSPDMQVLWQVAVSAPIFLAIAPFFGPLIRDFAPIHLWGLAFQIVIMVTLGFAFWFWLLSIYPAASVAAFSFLAPVFGVLFGWLFLNETLGIPILTALLLVSVGIVLINRPYQVPQKV